MQFEIKGNFFTIENCFVFYKNIYEVYNIFIDVFGKEIIEKYDLIVDNITNESEYTPIINILSEKSLTIKVGINDFSKEEKIVFQFSHELCHYVFYSLQGLDKTFADEEEENICTAMSLILIKLLHPKALDKYENYINTHEDKRYNKGYYVARECNYEIIKLKDKIYQKAKLY